MSDTIKNVIHISDIHIPKHPKRHIEYKRVFHKFYNVLDTLLSSELKSSILVITGDLLHNKDTLSAEQIMITRQFLDQCSKRLPVILMAGNHDLCLSNKSRLDSITPIVSGLSNVIYFSQSGIYTYHNIVFAVNSLSTNHYDNEIDEIVVNQKQPKFIKYNDIDPELRNNKICISLFHGMIEGAKNDCNYSFTCNVNMSWFEGYDLVLLGDIHRHQYLKSNMAYSGSFIQQNFGESIDNHGFICWDTFNKTSKFYNIDNEFCYYSCDIHKQESEILNDLKGKKEINLRLYYNEIADEKKVVKIISYLKKNSINVNEMYLMKNSNHVSVEKSNLLDSENLSCLEYQNDLMSKQVCDTFILNDLITLNKEIYGQVHKSESGENILKNTTWKLKRLLFKNVYCYLENASPDAEDMFHEIDFENFEINTKTGIFGNNHVGKSSIMDIILFVLFDKTSRGRKSDILSRGKKTFEIVLEFCIDNKTFRINKKGNKRGACLKTTCEFKEIDNENSPNHTGSCKLETTQIIKQMVCEYDDMVFMSFLFQNNYNGFLDLGNSEKVKFFHKMLKIGDFEKQCELAKGKLATLQKELEINQKRFIEIEKEISSKNVLQDTSSLEDDTIVLEQRKEQMSIKLHVLSLNKYDNFDEKKYQQICDKILKIKSELQLDDLNETNLEESMWKQIIENYEKFNHEKTKNLNFISHKKKRLQEEITHLVECTPVDLDDVEKARLFLKNPIHLECDKQIIQEHQNKKIKLQDYEMKIQETENKLSKITCVEYIDYDPNCIFCQKTFKKKHYEDELIELKKKSMETNIFIESNNELVEKLVFKTNEYEKQYEYSTNTLDLHKKYMDYIENKEKNDLVMKVISNVELEYTSVEKQVFPEYENRADTLQKIKNLRELNNEKLKLENTKDYSELKKSIDLIHGQILNNKLILKENSNNQAVIIYCQKNLSELSQIIENQKKQVSLYLKYVEIFGKTGIPNLLIQQSIPNVERLFNEYSASMDLGIKFRIEMDSSEGKDCKNIEIYCNEIPIDICSGFEKLITSVFMRVAIKNTHYIKTNFIFIDEAFTNMDSINFAKVPQLLSLLQMSFEHIFVITHQNEIKDIMDNCILVERNNLTFTY